MATAVELCSLFNHQGPGRDITGDVRGPTKDQFTSMNFTFDGSVYSGYRNLNYRVTQMRADTYHEGATIGNDVAGEVPINPERCFEDDFAGKLHDVADKAEPVVLG